MKKIFYILIALYVLLVSTGLIPLIKIASAEGFMNVMMSYNSLYIIFCIVIVYFLWKKSFNALWVSALISGFTLITTPVFFDINQGVLYSLHRLLIYFTTEHYQAFLVASISWLLPIVSCIGIIWHWYLDNLKDTKGSNEKHTS